MTDLILASVSPRRAELLKGLKLEFEIIPSEVEEIQNEHLTARELCQVNAYRKARAVSKKFPDTLVIGADTLVALDHKVFGKPKDRADALRMLQELQGRTHRVVSGICLIHLRTHRQTVFAEQTSVTFRPLSRSQIENYHQQVNSLDKAGAYAIQENGDALVEKISGSFSNVVGLPVERLGIVLSQFRAEVERARGRI